MKDTIVFWINVGAATMAVFIFLSEFTGIFRPIVKYWFWPRVLHPIIKILVYIFQWLLVLSCCFVLSFPRGKNKNHSIQ
jgi:hypothetical protein